MLCSGGLSADDALVRQSTLMPRRSTRSSPSATGRCDRPRASSRSPAPRPTDVRYNDWPAIDVPSLDAFTPTLPLSVVVSYHEAPHDLERLVAALEAQTYPRDLFEVVVADDGSATPARAPRGTPLDVRIVRQEDRGFGLARARNNGARAAVHDILVFLDGDMVPDATMLAAHARWHHAVADALTIGFRACLPDDGLDADAVRCSAGSLRRLLGREEIDQKRAARLRLTRDLTARDDDLFMAALGCNFAIRKAAYEDVGGSDESFGRYGWEDTELAYRVYARGGLLVPEREALSWHDSHAKSGSAGKGADTLWQRAKVAHRIPHPECRPVPSAGEAGIYAVPRHVVTVVGGDASATRIAATVERILADPAGDLVVRVETAPAPSERVTWLEDRFGPDPRVLVEPLRPALDEFPVTPFHLTVPAAARFRPGLVALLRRRLRKAVFATVRLPRGRTATIARGWALHRARRTGRPVAQFGDVVSVSRRAWPRPSPSREARRSALGHVARMALVEARRMSLGHIARKVLLQARGVRDAQSGVRFVRWLVRRLPFRRSTHALMHGRVERAAGPALGVEIATAGPRAAAVFAASTRVAPQSPGRRIEVLVADTRADARGTNVPTAILAEAPHLAVPALDPRVDGPVGWLRDVARCSAALGPVRHLPHPLRAHFRSAPSNREALRQAHHLIDVPAFHSGAVARAGVLLRVAASGVPIRLAGEDPELAALLGSELYGLMTDSGVGDADAAAREAFSIRMRRVALREHSLGARVRQLCEAAALPNPPRVPTVSLLLATRRPRHLAWAVRNVAAQSYPDLELILALRGDGFDGAHVDALMARLAIPWRVVRADASAPLGTVLNAATGAARGQFVSRIDDDGQYDAHHIADLMLAYDYSGAHLVGKGVENVYLERSNRTVRFIGGRAETYTEDLARGTLLIARQDLCRFGGWRPTAGAADAELIEDVRGSGGILYRTHGTGFVMVRRAGGAEDAQFLAQAETSRSGWHPELAGMSGDSEPPPGPLA